MGSRNFLEGAGLGYLWIALAIQLILAVEKHAQPGSSAPANPVSILLFGIAWLFGLLAAFAFSIRTIEEIRFSLAGIFGVLLGMVLGFFVFFF